MLGMQVSHKRDSNRVASRLISMDLQVLNKVTLLRYTPADVCWRMLTYAAQRRHAASLHSCILLCLNYTSS